MRIGVHRIPDSSTSSSKACQGFRRSRRLSSASRTALCSTACRCPGVRRLALAKLTMRFATVTRVGRTSIHRANPSRSITIATTATTAAVELQVDASMSLILAADGNFGVW
jgi:hypothetical protein